MPSAKLKPDARVHPDIRKPHGFMQPYAPRVRQSDPGIGVEVALSAQQIEQCRVQRTANALVSGALMYVNRYISGPLLGLPASMLRGVRVTQNMSTGFENEPGMPGR